MTPQQSQLREWNVSPATLDAFMHVKLPVAPSSVQEALEALGQLAGGTAFDSRIALNHLENAGLIERLAPTALERMKNETSELERIEPRLATINNKLELIDGELRSYGTARKSLAAVRRFLFGGEASSVQQKWRDRPQGREDLLAARESLIERKLALLMDHERLNASRVTMDRIVCSDGAYISLTEDGIRVLKDYESSGKARAHDDFHSYIHNWRTFEADCSKKAAELTVMFNYLLRQGFENGWPVMDCAAGLVTLPGPSSLEIYVKFRSLQDSLYDQGFKKYDRLPVAFWMMQLAGEPAAIWKSTLEVAGAWVGQGYGLDLHILEAAVYALHASDMSSSAAIAASLPRMAQYAEIAGLSEEMLKSDQRYMAILARMVYRGVSPEVASDFRELSTLLSQAGISGSHELALNAAILLEKPVDNLQRASHFILCHNTLIKHGATAAMAVSGLAAKMAVLPGEALEKVVFLDKVYNQMVAKNVINTSGGVHAAHSIFEFAWTRTFARLR